MSRGPSSRKRKLPDSTSPLDSLAEQELVIYNVIGSKQGIVIRLGDLKKEVNVLDNVAKFFLKSLEAKKLIKLAANVHSKIKKHYLAAEFEPSAEITGRAWYTDGKLDTGSINILKDCCLEQIEEIAKTLVLHNEIAEDL
ncbi:hypothetical protein TIFTF001_019185 [Ficus carica]|uniref:Uncharacterized protein n=1 Tax=Ficus carica TaxID=3494 RepID=A0AA88A8K7_FICCA|nr:hypothetical protein TIFTF001_019185 [Ficus carica]